VGFMVGLIKTSNAAEFTKALAVYKKSINVINVDNIDKEIRNENENQNKS